MALVSITEAAKLVRRNRSTLYRDIERGRLSKTITPEGETQIETSELLRTYGRLHANDPEHGNAVDHDKVRIAILEERNRSLERALALEAELRKVKDQVTSELRARLADKDSVIKVLESKVLFLEYDRQVESLKPEPAAEPASQPTVQPTVQPAPDPVSAPSAVAPDPAPEAEKAPRQPAPATEPSLRPAEQSAASAPDTEPHAAATPTDTPTSQAASSPSAFRADATIPLREADPSSSSFARPSAQSSQADTPIISSHVMPRKSWWARLLHRR